MAKTYFLPDKINIGNTSEEQAYEKRVSQFYSDEEIGNRKPPIPDEIIERDTIPVQDWMLVRLDLPMYRSREGGLILPENARPDPRVGIVIKVGPGQVMANPVFHPETNERIDCCIMPVSPGDVVMIDVATAGRVVPGNDRYKLFRFGNVAAKLDSNYFQEFGISVREPLFRK